MSNNQNQQIIQVGKNYLCEEDKELLEIPDFEENIHIQIEQAKKKYSLIILVGCVLSKFGVAFCYQYTHQSMDSNLNDKLYTFIQFFTIAIFTLILIGFIVDLVSFKISWRFNQVIFFAGILTFLASLLDSNNQYMVLAKYFFYFSFACNYVCGTYIIFDSTYTLKAKFIYQSLFIAFGSYFSFAVCLILNWFSLQQKIKGYYLFGLILIIMSIYFIGSLLVSQCYDKIVQIRERSQRYQLFLQYRGVGITLKSIIQFYLNRNNIYLLFNIISLRSMSSLSIVPFLIKSFVKSDQKYKQIDVQKTLALTFYLSNLFGIYIFFHLAKQQNIIALSYKILRNLLFLLTLYQIILTAVIYYQSQVNFDFLYIVFFIGLVFKGISNIIGVVLCNILLIALQSENSSIRCIGLGLFGALQDTQDILYYFDIQPIILNCLLFLIGILDSIYCLYYLKNRSFSRLESQYAIEINQQNNQNQSLLQDQS
ncbi:hypothetical protein ABPG74_022756 [Tetrahymena malaccensis]